MAHFHTLKVKDIRKETADCVSVAFDIPENLKQEFSYKAGQYLTLKFNIKGEEVRRSYSLSSSPDADNEFRIAVKKVDNGKVSTHMNDVLKAGEMVESMPPQGNFVIKDSATAKHYIGFAAGSGITPVISILKSILALNNGSKFTLFYGNKTAADTIFKAELDALNAKHDNLQVVYIYSRENQAEALLNGRLNAEKCNHLTAHYCNDNLAKEYYLCGPEDMIMGVSEALKSSGASKDDIHFELFTTPVNMAGNAKSQSEAFAGKSQVTVIIDDQPYNFELASTGKNILDASMDAGADAPFSCKGAVCCTCKAKVVEGKAIMDMNYALSDSEVEEGYILTCQAHPASEKVVVDFDVA
jgi:ring-1,2-phenylacetyl-CoA epoxidase subunit PaaE